MIYPIYSIELKTKNVKNHVKVPFGVVAAVNKDIKGPNIVAKSFQTDVDMRQK